MSSRTGFLTVLSADKREIYGEFADAEWNTQSTDVGDNHIFSGRAGDGTMDAFRRIDQDGISNVAYIFDTNGQRYEGRAHLLAPQGNGLPGKAVIQIESIENPH